MATAAQVLKAAFQRILVGSPEAPLEDDEYSDAIFAMNNYMLDLDANGVTLGYTVVSTLGDEITIPTGALRGLIANIAIEIAPDYDGVITDGLVRAAREGLNTMRKIGKTIVPTLYPSTLPIGSGNYHDVYGWHQHFYNNELEAEILAETTGAIGLETNTNEVANG